MTSAPHRFSRRVLLLTLLLAALLLALPGQAEFDAARLAAETERGMALWQVPGMAVAVVTSEGVEFQRGFGSTAHSGGQAVDEHTLFAIASTTKAMVVAGLLVLVDDGKLSLDDPLIEHLPEVHFPPSLATAEIRVRDLLTHRTGLPGTDFWTFFQAMPLAEQVARLRFVEPAAPPRSRFIYQNTMYELAGLLIERLSGQRWDQFLRERLWQPIGMIETFGARGQIGDYRSHVLPHILAGDRIVRADWDLQPENADAARSVWSSLHDMSLWARFLLRGGVTQHSDRLISEERMAEMFEPQQLAGAADFYPTARLTRPHWRSYGLGWFQQDFQGRKIDFHTGSLSGLIALIGLDRDNDRAVIVLGNRDHAELRHALLWEVMDQVSADTTADTPGDQRRDWNQQVFDLYAGLERERERDWQETQLGRQKNTRPSHPAEAYAGTYRSGANGDIRISRNGRRLSFDTELIRVQMEHWHYDTYLVEYAPWAMRELAVFRLGSDGQVRAIEVLGEEFERVTDGQGQED